MWGAAVTSDVVQIDQRQILAALALTAEQAEAIVGALDSHASRPNARPKTVMPAAGTPAWPPTLGLFRFPSPVRRAAFRSPARAYVALRRLPSHGCKGVRCC